MINIVQKAARSAASTLSAVALALMVVSVTPSDTRAGEAEAKSLLKAMSDYLAAQQSISFAYDTNFEVVTKDHQKLSLMSSGTITLSRPDKIRSTRTGGFVNVETNFDGKTLTLLGKNANVYTQVEVPGTLDHLIDELREKCHRPLPGADLLQSNVYDELMPEVVDVKDLGSGVLGGTECNHLAFRTKDVDWEMWIAQGDRPYPCRYVITSKHVDQGPQYSIQIRDWKTGTEVAAVDYRFTNATNAKQIDLEAIRKPTSNVMPISSRILAVMKGRTSTWGESMKHKLNITELDQSCTRCDTALIVLTVAPIPPMPRIGARNHPAFLQGREAFHPFWPRLYLDAPTSPMLGHPGV